MAGNAKLEQLMSSRDELETRLSGARSESENELATLERDLGAHRSSLIGAFKNEQDLEVRTSLLLEIVRSLELELIHLDNFIPDPSRDHRQLAGKLRPILEELPEDAPAHPGTLELEYYKGVLALFSDDLETALGLFEKVCESEESDELSDVKYKSYVMLGHLSHEERDFERAREMHEKSLEYTSHSNVTAQALALKALNSYALGEFDDATELFERSLQLFEEDEPHYNGYFHRNALLFCGAIYYDRRDYDRAENYYREALQHVDRSSYDYFDASSRLGKIHFSRSNWSEASRLFNEAVRQQRDQDNEYLVDTYYWLARTHLKNHDSQEARKCLERVVSSSVQSPRRSQAEELLASVS